MTAVATITRGADHAPHHRETYVDRPGSERRGLGTQLQQRGLPLGACPDAWNLTQPEKVEEVARAYVEAGSQVILTNTFGSNRFILARQGLADKVAEINRAGVAISRRAAAGRAMVFASVGPSGVMLMMGQVSTTK